jgi:hypothetical protein
MSILLFQGSLPVTDNPGIDTIDPRYDAIVSYVQDDNFIAAITLIEDLFAEEIFDIRMISYYLYGYWLDNGFGSLNVVLQCLNNILSDNFEAVGPIANHDQNFEKSLSWIMRQILKKINYEEKKNSSLWQQWYTSITEEDISHILETGEILCGTLTQKIPDKAVDIINLWNKIQASLKAIKKMVARPLDLITTETDNDKTEFPLLVSEENDLKGELESKEPINSYQAYETSYPMTLLLKKISAFERMINEKKFDRAALILEDIKLSLSTFEPTVYLPKIFENFVKLQALNINDLLICQQERGTVEWEVMQEWFKVDLDGFINS